MKKLIIAEKPSVARNIAEAVHATEKKDGYIEGNEYIISWAFGHLLQLFDAKEYDSKMAKWDLSYFPFIPETYKYKVKADSKDKKKEDAGAKKQLEIIRNLSKRDDVSDIISATDDDREGQVIADEIFLYLGIKKPIWRLLLNEWTSQEVERGLANLKANEDMLSLHDAGFGRQMADWLIGINLTSVATVKYNKYKQLLNVGRVLMPTLKIIYDRDIEIEKFTSSTYYKLSAEFATKDDRKYSGIYYELVKEDTQLIEDLDSDTNEKNVDEKQTEKFEKREFLEAIAKEIHKQPGTIVEKTVEKKIEYPPYLFNLTNLQGFITSKYKGWTSDKVLKIAQQLYEKKYTTYPRTASFVLDESIIPKVKKVLEIHAALSPHKALIQFHTRKRVFDTKKVESHSAIIPTYEIPKTLSEDEKIVYMAIRNRFLANFMPNAENEETVIKTKMDESSFEGYFVTRGKVVLCEGWKIIEKVETKTNDLPMLMEQENVLEQSEEITEVVRKPPKLHTEKTLLKVMETCGRGVQEDISEEMMMSILSGFSIGTPATRAETIKKLIGVGYIAYKGKNLTCTDLGRMMVEKLPADKLFDLNFTGRLEKTLQDIEHDRFTQTEFLEVIQNLVIESVEAIKKDFGSSGGVGTIIGDPKHVYGICPECGSNILETAKTFGCSNWRSGCKYAIWKDDKLFASIGKKITPEMVEILLQNGKVGFKGCKGKNGRKFAAYFQYKKEPSTGRYGWIIEYINDKG